MFKHIHVFSFTSRYYISINRLAFSSHTDFRIRASNSDPDTSFRCRTYFGV